MISISNLLAALLITIADNTDLFDTPIEVTTAENQIYTAADNARFKSKGKTTVLKGKTKEGVPHGDFEHSFFPF